MQGFDEGGADPAHRVSTRSPGRCSGGWRGRRSRAASWRVRGRLGDVAQPRRCPAGVVCAVSHTVDAQPVSPAAGGGAGSAGRGPMLATVLPEVGVAGSCPSLVTRLPSHGRGATGGCAVRGWRVVGGVIVGLTEDIGDQWGAVMRAAGRRTAPGIRTVRGRRTGSFNVGHGRIGEGWGDDVLEVEQVGVLRRPPVPPGSTAPRRGAVGEARPVPPCRSRRAAARATGCEVSSTCSGSTRW